MTLRRAYVAVRDLHADGGPALPDSWERAVQGSTGWTMITTPEGHLLAALLVNVLPDGRGLWAVFENGPVLEALALSGQAMPARQAWRERRAFFRAWPWWVCDMDGDERVRRTLIGVGEVLPAGDPPWTLSAGTVTRIYRPALLHGLAGRGLPDVLENEPDPGA